MSLRNRSHNASNPYQGTFKRVLCVCSAGLLRSPTAALVLSQEPYNCNTRAAGVSDDYGLIIVDSVLLEWADEIVCMTADQKHDLEQRLEKYGLNGKPVLCLDIQDSFAYRDPELIAAIKSKYDAAQIELANTKKSPLAGMPRLE